MDDTCTAGQENGSAVFDRDSLMRDLEEKGYTVVPGVLSPDTCDDLVDQIRQWLDKFVEDSPIDKHNSLTQQYRVSASPVAWEARLKAKPVFATVWGTEKLLSSMDGMAIGEPPELGNTRFNNQGETWFHFDQGSWRIGLHAFQGAMYLEETTEEDYCFRVIEGSCKVHKEFLDTFQEAKEDCAGEDFYILKPEYIEWYKNKGLKEKKVPVPKGGMVLWDSRTVHDNVKPEQNRLHSDRWRFVTFVCMTPARWARKKDLELKKEAFEKMVATAHWPSQGVWLFPSTSECSKTKHKSLIEMVDEIPEIAKTREVRLLVGLDEYDFEDGQPNDLGWLPEWSESAKLQVKSSPAFS
ncbi:uncharacterized protein LOC110458814 [Mizuhopecten yessoensis]|uniref:Phytanoyl-CoA dioxygenase n=1 Tax=Mizuhopecten yessoensis TaxID=6573 RepID=A0A210Q5M1_MIZYE|nr:uncharacterized protein LOC110458814 [Mizuhopecten yessoensis]OWF44015.1 hypothetical protein KP79_PYT21174 [Mizuhopecten yessoensis]